MSRNCKYLAWASNPSTHTNGLPRVTTFQNQNSLIYTRNLLWNFLGFSDGSRAILYLYSYCSFLAKYLLIDVRVFPLYIIISCFLPWKLLDCTCLSARFCMKPNAVFIIHANNWFFFRFYISEYEFRKLWILEDVYCCYPGRLSLLFQLHYRYSTVLSIILTLFDIWLAICITIFSSTPLSIHSYAV